MKKRTVKFKDGTTGSYTPKDKPQITFFPCERGNVCAGGTVGKNNSITPAYLNTHEMRYGNTCTACLLSDKKKQDVQELNKMKLQNKKNSDAMADALARSFLFMPDITLLEKKQVDYIGLLYSIEVYLVKGTKEPHIKITHPVIGVIFQSCTDIITKEGREVFMYCLKNVDDKNFPIIPLNSI